MDFDQIKAYIIANKKDLIIGAVIGFVIRGLLR